MAKRKDARKRARQTKKQEPINGQTLSTAVMWVLHPRIFDQLRFHGNTGWSVMELVTISVLWVWSEKSALTDAFSDACEWYSKVVGKPVIKSYQVLLSALCNHTSAMLPLIWNRLHQVMEQCGGSFWHVG